VKRFSQLYRRASLSTKASHVTFRFTGGGHIGGQSAEMAHEENLLAHAWLLDLLDVPLSEDFLYQYGSNLDKYRYTGDSSDKSAGTACTIIRRSPGHTSKGFFNFFLSVHRASKKYLPHSHSLSAFSRSKM